MKLCVVALVVCFAVGTLAGVSATVNSKSITTDHTNQKNAPAKRAIVSTVSSLLADLTKFLKDGLDGVSDIVGNALGAVKGITEDVLELAKSIVCQIVTSVINLVTGLLSGTTGLLGGVSGALLELAKTVVDSLRRIIEALLK